MKTIDSFSFFNEVELLKLRLNYLNEVVDHFIISECNYTHSGKLKPYYLDSIWNEIPEDIKKKIVRLKYEPDISKFDFSKEINEFDFSSDCWKIERSQRNYITESLQQFSPNDIFMISDMDEIPNKEVVKEYQVVMNEYSNMVSKNFCAVTKCHMFYYNFHTLCGIGWPGTAFSTVENAIRMSCISLYNERFNFFAFENGGWHFSTFGDVERIRTKIQSFAHQEYNKEKYINQENIENSIKNKEDIYHNHSTNLKEYDFLKFPKDLRDNIVKIFPEQFYKK